MRMFITCSRASSLSRLRLSFALSSLSADMFQCISKSLGAATAIYRWSKINSKSITKLSEKVVMVFKL